MGYYNATPPPTVLQPATADDRLSWQSKGLPSDTLCIENAIMIKIQTTSFLDEKFPPLERLEDEHISLMKERADMVAARRRAEDEDDLMLFLGTPPSLRPQAEEVDELGRAIPSAIINGSMEIVLWEAEMKCRKTFNIPYQKYWI